MRALNWLFRRVVKMRIEGPLNLQIEETVIDKLSKIKYSNTAALILIINSYGGSLRVAKNISHSLDLLRKKEIPVYCFAQEYCLNSANIILTSGTRCFANKLSVLGDFGYVYQSYSIDQLTNRYNIGLERVGVFQPKIDNIGSMYQYNDSQFLSKTVVDNANELKKQILDNRRDNLKFLNITGDSFEQKLLNKGTVVPTKAVELGLIDGLQTYNQFLRNNFTGSRIKEDEEASQYNIINFARNTLQVFKQE